MECLSKGGTIAFAAYLNERPSEIALFKTSRQAILAALRYHFSSSTNVNGNEWYGLRNQAVLEVLQSHKGTHPSMRNWDCWQRNNARYVYRE